MKNIFILLASMFLLASAPSFSQKIIETQYFENHPELGGDVVINSSTKEAVGSKTYTTFEVEVPGAGAYNMNAWLLATRLPAGGYANYDVLVNGTKIPGRICPETGNWQSIGLTEGKVSLRAGANKISFVGVVPDIPEIEFIRLSKVNGKEKISSDKYDNYLKGLKEENPPRVLTRSFTVPPVYPRDSLLYKFPVSDQIMVFDTAHIALYDPYRSAPKNFECVLNLRVQYTYYKTVSFTAGQKVFVATNGVNDFGHILELFSATKPESYSWVTRSNSNCLAAININIPVSGLYYVRVRSDKNAKAGLCNLNINGENYYENIPIYSMGLSEGQDTKNIYNSFTCYSTTDPRIWVEGQGRPGKICAYNDDYSGTGDFDWGLNSRIRKQYPESVSAVQVTSYGSYSPVGVCDLYVGCMDSNITPYFENLKQDDAIQSAPADNRYNCISFAGGIWDVWEWPCDPFSQFYVENGTALDCFDNFFSSPRYYDCSLFSREGATEANSKVDLWGKTTWGGRVSYTHSSVTKEADDQPHGFAWESKPGALMRTFHPRYALRGNAYGEVVEYYRCTYQGKGKSVPLYSSVAEGNSVLENVTFTDREKSYISSEKAKLTPYVVNRFNTLYAAWKQTWGNSIHSNPAIIKNCSQYTNLLDYCKSSPYFKYCVYEELGKGDVMAIELIKDLTLTNNTRNEAILARIKVYNASNSYTASGAQIVRTPYSNVMTYVKDLLATETPYLAPAKSTDGNGEATGITYSNTDCFNVTNTDKNILMDFSLDKEAVITLNIYDISGNVVQTLINKQLFTSGKYEYSTQLTRSGVYLVRLVVNGNINIKKVIIK